MHITSAICGGLHPPWASADSSRTILNPDTTRIIFCSCEALFLALSFPECPTRHLSLINMPHIVPHVEAPEKWKMFGQKVKKG